MKRLLTPAILLLMLTGCVQSIRPFYVDSQLIYDPAFVGTWTGPKQDFTLILTGNADDKSYNASYIDKDGKAGHFTVHLAKVQDHLIADAVPTELKTDENDAYKAHLLPLHSFIIVSIKADQIQLQLMNPDWLKKHLHDHPDAIATQTVNDKILLTATTEQAQAFVLKNLQTPGAYAEETVLTKLPAQPASHP